ncbi:hypothetical protein Tco_1413699, partial [Tanacetum coccineum]
MVVTLPFLVNLYHDGVFQVNPLQYVNFDSKVIDDVSFDGMSFNDFFATIRRLVLVSPTSMHYKIPIALKLLKTDEDLCSFGIDSDLEYSQTNHTLDDVAHVFEQFEHEDDGNVNIPRMTTDEPWLNKLVRNCTFIGQTGNPNPNLQGRFLLEVEDPDDEQGIKKGDGRKAVNEIISKAVKKRWDKKKENEKKGSLNKVLGRFTLRVDEWYSQCKWYEAYQFSIKPVYGPKFWKPTSQPPPLPPVERKMHERPKKRRIRHPTEDEDHAVTRVGRVMHCHKCWETRHNKTRCTNQERPKCAYLKSKGVVFHDGLSRSMPPPTTIPSSSNTMPPPHTSSSSNTMPLHPTPSTSNTMPPPGLNTITGSNTMPSLATFASTGTNKGKGPLIL